MLDDCPLNPGNSRASRQLDVRPPGAAPRKGGMGGHGVDRLDVASASWSTRDQLRTHRSRLLRAATVDGPEADISKELPPTPPIYAWFLVARLATEAGDDAPAAACMDKIRNAPFAFLRAWRRATRYCDACAPPSLSRL
jgi:hypothetical protein